jgi:hypothetical protein
MDGIEPFVRWGRRGSGGLAMDEVMRALAAANNQELTI